MTDSRLRKSFEQGRGYTKDDWDAVDSPELTDEELAGMRPAREVLPPEFFAAVEEMRRKGRPPLAAPKKLVSLRLDPDVIEKFKATGRGWQTRINEVLKAAKP